LKNVGLFYFHKSKFSNFFSFCAKMFVVKCLLMVFNNLYMEMNNLYNIHMNKNRWVENSFWTKMLIWVMGVQKNSKTFRISFCEHRTYLLWWITKQVHYMCMINITFYDIELEINVVAKWKFYNFIWYMSAELKYTNGKGKKVVR
jgi:hypothetical protein